MKSSVNVVIIIPTLNEENFIENCLESVLNQSYPLDLLDIIVVDGGSTDNTCVIVQNMIANCDSIRLLNNPDKIQSSAFNIGVAHSIAPYIIRLDAHSTYDKKYIEKCISHLVADASLGNVGGIWNIRPQSKSVFAKANALLNQSKFGIGGADYRVNNSLKFVDSVPFGAYPRKVVETVGQMNPLLARGEDNEYNWRVRSAGYKILLDPDIKINYFARKTLIDSSKQMYKNGISIADLLKINPKMIGIRHLVPALFVLFIIVFGSLSFLCFYCKMFLLFVLSLYFILAVCESTKLCLQNKNVNLFLPLITLFVSVHISYGFGTLRRSIKHILKL